MEALGFYLLKVHIGMTLLYASYHFFLKDQLHFRLNRWALLSAVLLSFMLPLMPQWNFASAPDAIPAAGLVYTQELTQSAPEIARLDDEIYLRRVSGVIITIVAFYLVGFFFYLSRFIGQLLQVRVIISEARREESEHGVYYRPLEEGPAFSFFDFIILRPERYSTVELRRVMAHESAHAAQMHSVDILLSGLAHCILWPNPLAARLKYAIKLNLEFLADQEVLRRGFDKKAYQWSIVSPYMMPTAFPLTNAYGSSPKQRIEKMNALARPAWQIINYLAILVACGFIYLGVSPLQAAVLNRIDRVHLIDAHAYRDYLGYYEMEIDKGTYVQVVMKNDSLLMKTLWNNQQIPFKPVAPNAFFSKESDIMLTFPRNIQGAVRGFVACGDDRWQKVDKYIPQQRTYREAVRITRGRDGALHVGVYAVEPWGNVKNYAVKKGISTQ